MPLIAPRPHVARAAVGLGAVEAHRTRVDRDVDVAVGRVGGDDLAPPDERDRVPRGACRAAGSCRRGRRRSASAGRPATSATVPSCATRPCSSTTRRSASATASSSSWVTSTRAPGKDERWVRSSRRSSVRVPMSSAASGSSRSTRRRLGHERPRQRDALLLARRRAPPASHRHGRARPTRSSHAAARRRASRSCHAAAAQPEGDVLEHGQVREQQVVLEHHPDRPSLGLDEHVPRRIVDDVAVDGRRSPIRGRAAPRARAAASSCPRRSGRAPRPSRPRRRGSTRRDRGRRVGARRAPQDSRTAPNHRSRSSTSTTIDTRSSTRLSMIAVPCWASRRR